MRFLRTNTAVIVTVGPFYDKTDGVTIETALTITNERITLTADTDNGSAPTNVLDNITGATSGTSNDLNYITGNDAGLMQLELSAADTNRFGRMFLSITDAANHVPVFHEFMVLPAAVYDGLVAGSNGFPVAVPFDPPTQSIRLLSGVSDQYIYFTAYNSTDHRTRQTGLTTFVVYRSRNGGAATLYTTPTISEISSSNMPGVYRLLLDEDMTLDAGDYSQQMVLYITATGMQPVEKTVEIFRRDVDAPLRGVALSDIPFYMVDGTDHVTAKTGLTITAQVAKDGGAFAAAAGTAAEVSNGLYQFDATSADMTADVVVFRFTGTGADPTLITIKTVS